MLWNQICLSNDSLQQRHFGYNTYHNQLLVVYKFVKFTLKMLCPSTSICLETIIRILISYTYKLSSIRCLTRPSLVISIFPYFHSLLSSSLTIRPIVAQGITTCLLRCPNQISQVTWSSHDKVQALYIFLLTDSVMNTVCGGGVLCTWCLVKWMGWKPTQTPLYCPDSKRSPSWVRLESNSQWHTGWMP